MAKTSHDALIETLRKRFAAHPQRHRGLAWEAVAARIASQPNTLAILAEMESTGGEPDVVGQESDAFVFVDCAAESPTGRRSLCYDRARLMPARRTSPRARRRRWPRRWASRCSPKCNTVRCSNSAPSILRPQAGSQRRMPFASSAARCSVTGGTIRCSSITMALNPITPRAAFAGG